MFKLFFEEDILFGIFGDFSSAYKRYYNVVLQIEIKMM